MKLKIDFHIHSEKSFDGRMSFAEIQKTAKEKGIDGVAIADHDVANTIEHNGDVLIIPAIELSTEYGHILCYFIDKQPEGEDDLEKIKYLKENGALVVLAHPYERTTDSKKFDGIVPYIDGIEIFNARADKKIKNANALADKYSKDKNKLLLAGSDAHLSNEIGNAYVVVNAKEKSVQSVKEALLNSDICEIHGIDTKYFNIARSQWTRNVKKKRPITKKIKWFFFMLNCILIDLTRKKKNYSKIIPK